MRIISKFKDYYDNALTYGIDQDTIYVRLAKSEVLNSKKPMENDPFVVSYTEVDDPVTGGKVYLNYGKILFCGSFHRFVYHDVTPYNRMSEYRDWKCYYSLEELGTRFNYIPKKYKSELLPTYADEVQFNPTDKGIACNIHWNAPVVSWTVTNSDKITRTINPCLRNVDFYKVVDPFQTFQEISMFLNGPLATADKPVPVEISDKIRAEKHGMDKWSFRTKVR